MDKEIIEFHKTASEMVSTRKYNSGQRRKCKKEHGDQYGECPDPDCPYAWCDKCKVDYLNESDYQKYLNGTLETIDLSQMDC